MLNQRLFAALLAVTAVTTTIGVNIPSSYAVPRYDPYIGQYLDEAADSTLWIVQKVKQGGQWVWQKLRRAKPPKPRSIQNANDFFRN